MSAHTKLEWGPWTYNSRALTLDITVGPGYIYDVDLEQMGDADAIHRWIAHIAPKKWATTDVVGGLVLAIYSCIGLAGTVHRGDALRSAITARHTLAEQLGGMS